MPSQSSTQKYLSVQPSSRLSPRIAFVQSSTFLQFCQASFSEFFEIFDPLWGTACYQNVTAKNSFRVLRVNNPILVSANRNDVHAHPSGQVKSTYLLSLYW